MIAKKNKKFNLERKRFAFFQIGLLISGSLCLAAFEYSTAVPDEYAETLGVEDYGTVLEDPKEDIDVIIIEKKKTATIINLNDLDKIKIVKKMTVEGKIKLTSNNDIISVEGEGDPFGGIDLTISDPSGPVVDVPDVEPHFVGGLGAMSAWIQENMLYPELCVEMGIQGLVYVQFVVNKTGSITAVNTLKSPHDLLTVEAERMVKKMPKWVPGEQAGKKVRVRFTLPINFKLR